MGITTTNGSGYFIRYTTGQGSGTVEVVSTSTNQILGTSVQGSTAGAIVSSDLNQRLDFAVQQATSDIARYQSQIDALNAKIAASTADTTPVLLASWKRQVADAQTNIANSNADIAAIQAAKADVSANTDNTLANLHQQEAQATAATDPATKGDTAATKVDPANATPTSNATVTSGNVTSTPTTPVSTEEKANVDSNGVPTAASPTAPPAATTPNSDDAANASAAAKTSTANSVDTGDSDTSPDDQSIPQDNPFHQLASYTYGLSLHILPPQTLNALTDVTLNSGEGPSYAPLSQGIVSDLYDGKAPPANSVLIASANRVGADLPRNSHFLADFYFEELKMTTIIGMNARTRGANAINISFTLIEPYGITLLNRLIDVCNDFNIKNYLEAPYLLQIDFFGYNQEGSSVDLTDHQKLIPIRILSTSINLSEKGAVYKVEAVPYSTVALEEVYTHAPANFEVYAGTVGEFFSSGSSASAAGFQTLMAKKDNVDDRADGAQKALAAQNAKNKKGEPGSAKAADESKDIEKERAYIKDMPYKAGSFTDAINQYQKTLKDANKVPTINDYLVVVHKDFVNSKIVDPKTQSHKKAPPPNNDNVKDVLKLNLQDLNNTSGFDTSKTLVPISAGTSMVDIINEVMRNSDYILDQLNDKNIIDDDAARQTKDPEPLAAVIKKPLKWYKIIPSVQLKDEFDSVKNEYAKVFVYHIVPYTLHNTKYPFGPQGDVANIKPAKEYNYIYTGKNKDIIDLKINFDATFYVALQQFPSNQNQVSGAPNSANTNDGKIASSVGSPDDVQNTHNRPRLVQQSSQTTSTTRDDPKAVAAMDLTKSLYTRSPDMMSLDMKIIGDPHFIKQDEIFIQPGGYPDDPAVNFDDQNSLITDARELYVSIAFTNPTDIDLDTGGLKTYDGYKTKVFEGLYRLLTVDNYFQQGTFTQSLNLVRLFNQNDDDQKKTNEERSAPTTTANASPAPASSSPQGSTDATVPKPDTTAPTAPSTPAAAAAASASDEHLPNAPSVASLAQQTTVPINQAQQQLADVANSGTTATIQGTLLA